MAAVVVVASSAFINLEWIAIIVSRTEIPFIDKLLNFIADIFSFFFFHFFTSMENFSYANDCLQHPVAWTLLLSFLNGAVDDPKMNSNDFLYPFAREFCMHFTFAPFYLKPESCQHLCKYFPPFVFSDEITNGSRNFFYFLLRSCLYKQELFHEIILHHENICFWNFHMNALIL